MLYFSFSFMGIDALLSNYLITALITFGIYIIAFIFFVRQLRRAEDQYLIVANGQGVSFLKRGKYSWSEVVAIDAYTEIKGYAFGKGSSRYEAKFVRITLVGGLVFSLEVTNCDYEYLEIAQRLNKIGHLFNSNLISANKKADTNI